MDVSTAFGPRGDTHITFPACDAHASSTDALVELLERMKAEAERNARTIDALDRRTLAGAQQLHELLAFNERAEAELSEIETKSSSSAGTARAHAEVLAAEQRYARHSLHALARVDGLSAATLPLSRLARPLSPSFSP